ncbi:MAG: DUF4244 domain-containing protein [Acidimicrobiales bacterium]
MIHLLTLVTVLQSRAVHRAAAVDARRADPGSAQPSAGDRRGRRDDGQTTAEYALVLLGAAAIAVLIISWATKTNLIGKLFDFVIDHVMGKAG